MTINTILLIIFILLSIDIPISNAFPISWSWIKSQVSRKLSPIISESSFSWKTNISPISGNSNGNFLGPPSDSSFPISTSNDDIGKFSIFRGFIPSNITWTSFSTNKIGNVKQGKRFGLLLILFPSIFAQLNMLQQIIPFLVVRLSQYLSPMSFMLIGLVNHPRGRLLMNAMLLSGMAIGGMYMIIDTFQLGSKWAPIFRADSNDTFAIVTGASTGLGYELTRQLYHKGYNIVMIARNDTQLKEIIEDLYSQSMNKSISWNDSLVYPRLIPISCNLAKISSSYKIFHELQDREILHKVKLLINNVGVAYKESFRSTSPSQIVDGLHTNIHSAVVLTRLLLPSMISNSMNNLTLSDTSIDITASRILFVSSISSQGPLPEMSIYAASKAFLQSFASTLRRELIHHNVFVTSACLGPIHTPFAIKTNLSSSLVYQIPFFSSSPSHTAKEVIQAIEFGRDSITPGLFNKLYVHVLTKCLPGPFLASIAKTSTRPIPMNSVIRFPSISINYFRNRWEDTWRRFWFSPIINYKKLPRKFSFRELFRGKSGLFITKKNKEDDEEFNAPMEEEVFNSYYFDDSEDEDKSEDPKEDNANELEEDIVLPSVDSQVLSTKVIVNSGS